MYQHQNTNTKSFTTLWNRYQTIFATCCKWCTEWNLAIEHTVYRFAKTENWLCQRASYSAFWYLLMILFSFLRTLMLFLTIQKSILWLSIILTLSKDKQLDKAKWTLVLLSKRRCNSIKAKMSKVENEMKADLGSIYEKVSKSVFLPALKYGTWEMEPVVITRFVDIFSKTHKNVKVKSCGLFLEVKCPYSINYTSPTNAD